MPLWLYGGLKTTYNYCGAYRFVSANSTILTLSQAPPKPQEHLLSIGAFLIHVLIHTWMNIWTHPKSSVPRLPPVHSRVSRWLTFWHNQVSSRLQPKHDWLDDRLWISAIGEFSLSGAGYPTLKSLSTYHNRQEGRRSQIRSLIGCDRLRNERFYRAFFCHVFVNGMFLPEKNIRL